MEKEFTQTVPTLARESQVTEATVRRYADMGLLEFIVLDNGTRLFAPGQAKKVREILSNRMANRTRTKALQA